MSAISDDIAKAAKEAAEKLAEAERLGKLEALYPDLQKYTGRWGKVAYYSKSVNSQVTRFDIRHNCGCCNDSPLEIWPYLETPAGNVYSDPPKFVVGERDPYTYEDRPRSGWKEQLEAAGIPEIIVGAIGMHFKRSEEAAREHIDNAYGEES